jgi:hypothetical protein
MQERISQVGGKVEFISKPARGFEVQACDGPQNVIARESATSGRISRSTHSEPEQSAVCAEALAALQREYHARLASARSSTLLIKLINSLFELPVVTIGGSAKLLDVTPAAASANLAKLVESRILVEVTGRRRNQRYLARELGRGRLRQDIPSVCHGRLPVTMCTRASICTVPFA